MVVMSQISGCKLHPAEAVLFTWEEVKVCLFFKVYSIQKRAMEIKKTNQQYTTSSQSKVTVHTFMLSVGSTAPPLILLKMEVPRGHLTQHHYNMLTGVPGHGKTDKHAMTLNNETLRLGK